ncbi:MAG: hypothetical protein OXH68_18970 [Gammaproteobacteria bacterium]|nr:hypothetical protein [Gammaproteobacteria bacterium]
MLFLHANQVDDLAGVGGTAMIPLSGYQGVHDQKQQECDEHPAGNGCQRSPAGLAHG